MEASEQWSQRRRGVTSPLGRPSAALGGLSVTQGSLQHARLPALWQSVRDSRGTQNRYAARVLGVYASWWHEAIG
jgi:hypothetical protein